MNSTLDLVQGFLLWNGVFLGIGVLCFYVGMRLPRHALKLAVLLAPIAFCSAIWAVGTFRDFARTSTESSQRPECGKNVKCWERFEKIQKELHRKQARELLKSLMVPLFLFVMLWVLIRRDRFARCQASMLKDKEALLAAPLDVSLDFPPLDSSTESSKTAPLDLDHTGVGTSKDGPWSRASSDGAAQADARAGSEAESSAHADPHERWWLPKEKIEPDLPVRQDTSNDERWMPRPPPEK